MSRNYSLTKPKKHFVYSVEEVMDLFDVNRNTISNWIGQGLKPSDQRIPYVFRGAELRRFLEARHLKNHAVLRRGQFKCVRCKAGVFPLPETISLVAEKGLIAWVSGVCPECQAPLSKIVNETDRDAFLKCVITNTSVEALDEGMEQAVARIGKDDAPNNQPTHSSNDRPIHDWLTYAGKYEEKTVLSHLAAIRDFEVVLGGKCFKQVTIADVAGYRESLKSRLCPDASRPLSNSTIRHRASFLRSFFRWLRGRKGFESIDQNIEGYFDLPKRFEEPGLKRDDRPIPTIEEAAIMIKAMPVETWKERRDQAMVSIAFLGALRADTIISLRLEHLIPENKQIVQNGCQSRTKNGKSVRIRYFPVPLALSATVEAWKAELVALGFQEKDALFPDERWLAEVGNRSRLEIIPVMRSIHAITSAFKSASARFDKRWSPHSAKHCIGRLGSKVCKTVEDHRAWSANMGHENEDVTRRYYQKPTSDRIDEIFQAFERPEIETPDDKELMIRYFNYELDRGTTEFKRAAQLIDLRQQRLSTVRIPTHPFSYSENIRSVIPEYPVT